MQLNSLRPRGNSGNGKSYCQLPIVRIVYIFFLDKKMGLEMVDLIYLSSASTQAKNLMFNFVADFPPLSKGLTNEMVVDYEGESAHLKIAVEDGEATRTGENADEAN